MGEAECEAVRRVLLSGWLAQGPETAAFEAEFAERVGADRACAVANGTAALHLALRAVGVGPGDEVVTVSYSFVATANSVRYCGATPVFVDVEPHGDNLDPDRVAPALGPRTRALLVVHQLGMPCDLGRLVPLAREHGLPLVEDAACALGSRFEGRPIGKPHGDVACFSLHPRKLLTTGEGGMLTTSRPEWDAAFRRWRTHSLWEGSYQDLGYNYRMTDVQAAIGREQLRRLDRALAHRKRLVAGYRGRLDSVSGLELPREPAWAESNWQSFAVRLEASAGGVVAAMKERGIETRPGIACAHLQPAFRQGGWSCRPGQPCPHGPDCPLLRQSRRAQDTSLMLPLCQDLDDHDLDEVCRCLVQVLQRRA